jgi:hypothetical protein
VQVKGLAKTKITVDAGRATAVCEGHGVVQSGQSEWTLVGKWAGTAQQQQHRWVRTIEVHGEENQGQPE